MAIHDQDDREQQFTLTDLRKEFEVTPRALRFYEVRGLLSPTRDGTTRVYSGTDRARLKLTLQGKRFGFTLTEIKDMLDLYSVGDNGAEQRRIVSKKYRKQVTFLREQINDMVAALEELESSANKIDLIRAKNGEI